jgi:hypothetical protein
MISSRPDDLEGFDHDDTYVKPPPPPPAAEEPIIHWMLETCSESTPEPEATPTTSVVRKGMLWSKIHIVSQ